MSRPYQPANGTEGEWFQSKFCHRCRRDSESEPCAILLDSMTFTIGTPDYPAEWIEDDAGPRCTAFQTRTERTPDMTYEERDTLSVLATLDRSVKIAELASLMYSYDFRLRTPLGYLVQKGLVCLDNDLEYTITVAGREALERTKARMNL